MFQTNVEKSKHNLMFNKHGIVRRATDGNIIRHTKDAICMPDNYGKNTDTHSEYVIFIMS
jgi:hypothetical protein